ncbi:MAG: efflux transporter outer membrane subunit [Bacteroidetes bacterium]|jgi:NodT family efflux transporter outer membrane factor (OMF) lipoprotein|nr:efflux transporter outer membrane subunit [Bacteroidota bacterium]
MKIAKGIFIIFTALSLQSCFVAKEYSRPENSVDESLYRTDQLSTDSLSMATISWREIFTDEILQDYIEEGLENNMDIRIGLQQINIAEAYLRQGKAAYFPTLNAQAVAMHQEFSESSQYGGQISSINQFELSGALSWEADIWGKIRSNERAANAVYLQSVAAHRAVKSRLVANIASVYYQLLALDEQIKITEETIATRTKSLETTKALKEAGSVTEVGVKQTEAQLYNAQSILVNLKEQSKLLENTLAILLGSSPQEFERNSLEEQEIDVPLTIGVPTDLLSNRPDVMAAEYELIQAFELTNVARSNFYPSLTLSASGGLQALEIDKLFDANSLFASVIGGLTQPIFNGRRFKTQYEVSQAQQEQAFLRFKNTLLVAGKEVSDALVAIQTAEQIISLKENENDAYQLSVDYSMELLNNGFANYLEVLTAEERALASGLEMIAAQNARLQSIVNLYRALGGGWID